MEWWTSRPTSGTGRRSTTSRVVEDGLGPLYNAQSCRECHQDPTSGGASQITELRVGHLGPDGKFRNPEIPIGRGTEIITGRTLVNDRAICPSGAFPDTEIHERVPETEKIRTTRISLNLLGDGFVEAVADQTLLDLAREQCRASHADDLRPGDPRPDRGSVRRRDAESDGSAGRTSTPACSLSPGTRT